MTNEEYEAACITAAGCYDRFEGEHKLEQHDRAIAVLEASLKRLHEERRGIVNRYGLNKCEHYWMDVTNICDGSRHWYCPDCGARKEE